MSSKANLFLVLNLGSEMLYVIDQRLRAQSIALDKSAQVLRDLSNVLLDNRFLDQLIETEMQCGRPLSPPQIRTLLADIACCSLMRLDPVSMDKLWDLMVILYKWQMFVAKADPHRLINVTFKHLDGVAKLMPEMKKGLLVDVVKMKILTLWDSSDDEGKQRVADSITNWLHPFNVKISILMRLGLQDNDCNFVPIDLSNKTHSDLLANIGENVYKKYPKNSGGPMVVGTEPKPEYEHREFDELAEQLQITTLDRARAEPHETMLSILDTLNLGGTGGADGVPDRPGQSNHEFVQIRSSNSNSRDEYFVDPEKVLEPDLLQLMKIPPHIPKY